MVIQMRSKPIKCVVIEDKMKEVKHIVVKLQSTHGKKCSVEQYHAWAQARIIRWTTKFFLLLDENKRWQYN